MHIRLTFLTLALMTFLVLLLRIFWQRVPAAVRVFLIRVAVVLFMLEVLLTVSKWEINSDHLNVTLKWLAIASYELLIMLFASLPPRWLTTLCAFILLVPVFGASMVMPLVSIFGGESNKLTPIGHNLFYQNVPWGGDSSANSGSNLKIFYRPPFAPFLRRVALDFPFNVEECNAYGSIAILQPDGKHVLARCPHWPTQPPGIDERLFPLH
jgi:hypothetical protein